MEENGEYRPNKKRDGDEKDKKNTKLLIHIKKSKANWSGHMGRRNGLTGNVATNPILHLVTNKYTLAVSYTHLDVYKRQDYGCVE